MRNGEMPEWQHSYDAQSVELGSGNISDISSTSGAAQDIMNTINMLRQTRSTAIIEEFERQVSDAITLELGDKFKAWQQERVRRQEHRELLERQEQKRRELLER